MSTHTAHAPRLVFTAVACFALSALPAQSPITWSVNDIRNAASDVSTRGQACIAVNMGPEVCESVVNGVHFMADRSHFTRKILLRGGAVVRGQLYFPEWRSGGYVFKAPYNRTAPNIGARHSTEPAYDAILKDGRHSSGGTGTRAVTCTIEGLTPGNIYEIQIFYGNAGRPTRVTEWDNGNGGRAGAGGIYLRAAGTHFGQVATGTFTADASGTQSFSNLQHPADNTVNPPIPETYNACSAIQVRELSRTTLAPRATYYGEGTPGTNTQQNLGGTKCSPGITFVGHPKVGTAATLTAENSQDAASSALIVVGLNAANVSFLGGTLLVNPALTLPVPMPRPASPYVHDHELQVPIPVPAAPGVTFYVQVLQLDPNAVGGVSMTAGVKIEVGL